MKLPLRYGIPLLIVFWLASGYTDYGQGKTLLMVLAMGVAMWTAFSLPRPRKWRPEITEDEDASEDGEAIQAQEGSADRAAVQAEEGDAPANGRGRRPPPDPKAGN